MNNNIKLTQLHTDVLKKFTPDLDINSIFNLCVSNKRFDELIFLYQFVSVSELYIY